MNLKDCSFKVTSGAQAKIKEKLDNKKASYLRVGVLGSGCSGYKYHLELWYKEPRNNDLLFQFGDVKILIDKKSILLLNGTELYWKSTLMFQGFNFLNPNVKSVCCCHESFSI